LRSHGYYDLANAIDTIEFVAQVVQFLYDFGNFAKKVKSFFKDFSLKGYFKDIFKNTKEFFSKNQIGHLLFGGKFDGGFLVGKPAEVLGRVNVVFNIIKAGYETVDYYDPFNKKSDGEYYWKTWKPVAKNILKNVVTDNLKRRHDIVVKPNPNKPERERIYDQKTGDLIGDKQQYTEDLIDESTGKKVGTRETTVKQDYTTGKTITDKTSTYTYEGGVKGTGETKTVTEHSEEYGKKENGNYHNTTTVTTNTTTKTDEGSSWKKHIKTVTSEEKSTTTTTVDKNGTEKTWSKTDTSTNTKAPDNNIFKGGNRTTTTDTDSHVVTTTEKGKDGFTSTKTTTDTVTHSETAKSPNDRKYTSSNMATHSTNETLKESNGNVVISNTEKTTTWTHDNKGGSGSIKKDSSYSTNESYNYGHGNKGSSGETVTQKDNGDVKYKTTHEKAPAYEPTKPSTTSKPSTKPEVVSSKVSTDSKPNIPGKIEEVGDLIDKYDKTAQNINKVSPTQIPTTEGAREKVNAGVEYIVGEGNGETAGKVADVILDTFSSDKSKVIDDIIDWNK
jgi:hypothetical protein